MKVCKKKFHRLEESLKSEENLKENISQLKEDFQDKISLSEEILNEKNFLLCMKALKSSEEILKEDISTLEESLQEKIPDQLEESGKHQTENL